MFSFALHLTLFYKQISDDQVSQLINNKCLEKLKEFDVSRAPKLTMMAARMLVKHCPKLRHLQDLGE